MTFSLRNRAILSGRVTSVLVNDKKKVFLSSATNKTTSLRFALHTLIGNFGKLKQPTRNVISFVQVTTPLVNLSDTTTQLFERRVKFCVRMTKKVCCPRPQTKTQSGVVFFSHCQGNFVKQLRARNLFSFVRVNGRLVNHKPYSTHLLCLGQGLHT